MHRVATWLELVVNDKQYFSPLDLQLGELAHDDLFGLFEAMSAIEMMDPKMDAGMNQMNCGSKKVLGFDQAVKAGKLELCDIPLQQLIG